MYSNFNNNSLDIKNKIYNYVLVSNGQTSLTFDKTNLDGGMYEKKIDCKAIAKDIMRKNVRKLWTDEMEKNLKQLGDEKLQTILKSLEEIENDVTKSLEKIEEKPKEENAKEIEEKNVEGVCSICLENKSNTVFIDCSHLCICSKCSELYKGDCPICRKPGKRMTLIIV